MRWKRYIIPVVVFILTVVGFWLDPYYRSWKIASMIDEAGRNGEPVIIGLAEIENKMCYLVSNIHGNSVRLDDNDIFSEAHSSYMTDDGTLKIITAKFVGTNPVRYKVPMPEVSPVNDSVSNCFELTGSRHWKPSLWDQRYICTYPDCGLQLWDLETYTKLDFDLCESEPWLESWNESTEWSARTSLDGSMIYLRFHAVWAGDTIIWQFDIQNGKWSKFHNTTDREYQPVSVGPGGKIFALGTQSGPHSGPQDYCEFFNGETRDLIKRVENIVIVEFSENWIIGKLVLTQGGFKAINLNSWEEAVFTIPFNNIRRFFIYEPPPGGVSEMLEMRKSEN